MIAYRASSSNEAAANTVDVTKPSGLAENDVMLALVAAAGSDGAYPTITAPDGWAAWGTSYTFATGGWYWRVTPYYKRAGASEGSSYTWSHNKSSFVIVGMSAYSGCIASGNPIDVSSSLSYTTNDTTLRAGTVTTTLRGEHLVALGCQYSGGAASSPDGWTERLDIGAGITSRLMVSDAPMLVPGATGNIDFVIPTASYKRCFLAALKPTATTATTPVISSPAAGDAAVPGATFTLTATATDPLGGDVVYRWKYSKDGGADQTIGDSDPADSGTAESIAWDTTGLDLGTYALKCWSVDLDGGVSATYDEVTIYLADVVITAPADGSSHVSGAVSLTAKGYLAAAGKLRLQWEIDTANPPSSANADYDLVSSGLVDQGVATTVTGNVSHLGTWYARARTLDTSDSPSDWTEVLTLYVLEVIRLDAGSQVEQTIAGSYNKVYCYVEGSSASPIVGTATNTTVAPTYASSPRELYVTAPEGSDLTAANAIAAAQLAIHSPERENLTGLRVRLEDGLRLHVGDRVGVAIERMDIQSTYTIREMTFDVAGDAVDISVGEFWEPQTDQDALVAIAQKVQQLAKEAAG